MSLQFRDARGLLYRSSGQPLTHLMAFSLPFPLPLLSSFLLFSSALILYILRPLFFIFIARVCSPLRLLPSPPSPSFFVGNLAQLADQENNYILHSWTDKYGNTFTYRGFLNAPRLITIDPLALSYILGHAYDFPKPDFITDALAEMGAGHDGLITAHGDVHKRQVCLLPSQLLLHCHSSHSDPFSAVSWYRTFPLGDAICLFPDYAHYYRTKLSPPLTSSLSCLFSLKKPSGCVSSNCSQTLFSLFFSISYVTYSPNSQTLHPPKVSLTRNPLPHAQS